MNMRTKELTTALVVADTVGAAGRLDFPYARAQLTCLLE